jgi:hypothetical protein
MGVGCVCVQSVASALVVCNPTGYTAARLVGVHERQVWGAGEIHFSLSVLAACTRGCTVPAVVSAFMHLSKLRIWALWNHLWCKPRERGGDGQRDAELGGHRCPFCWAHI